MRAIAECELWIADCKIDMDFLCDFLTREDCSMHELILALPDELYTQLQAKAASKGISLKALIMEWLAAETAPMEQQEEESRLLHEALSSTGLLQPIGLDLIATYVSDPSAPRRSPIQVQGKPLSTIIVEQRAGLK